MGYSDPTAFTDFNVKGVEMLLPPPPRYDLRDAWDLTAVAAMPTGPDPDEDLVGVDEVAAHFGMSVRWVYETFTVEVPPMKFGNRSRWYRWQLKAYTAEKYRAAAR